MKEFDFYIEYDGKRSHRLEENQTETILAGSIEQAIKKFNRRKKLVLESIDELEEGTYRVFLEQRNLFKGARQYIYFVIIGD